jgi:hypothetical protein
MKTPNNNEEMTLAERERRFEERLRQPIPRAKPKPTPVVMVPVTEQFAAKVAARPEDVRVFVRGDDGTTAVERPQPNPNRVTVLVDRVTAVDDQGRPVWDRPGVVHEYNPLDRL